MFLKAWTFLYIIYWGFGNILTKDIPDTRPNIVLIMTDDMGLDDTSFRGGKEFLTPNIDALAYHGKILNRLYTPPMCTPSRAALMTGLYPIRTGTQHHVILNEDPWGILDNITSMAEIFQAEGYSTNLVGKWHLGMGRKEFTPTYKGFDTHYGYWGAYIDYFRMRSQMPSNYSLGYDFRRNMELECPPEGSYVTDLFTREAESIILKNKGQPLLLVVNHLAVHTANDDEPLQAPQDEIDKFDYIPDIRRRTYAAMTSKLDESVGRIVKALDKTNQLKNSIIIFYSDNGAPSVGLFSNTGSNWPLRGQKNSPWEGGIRVTGAIWSPLLKNKASIYQPPIYVGDFLPTLAAAAKIPLETWQLQLDGLNHWPDLVASKTNTLITTNSDREIVHMLNEIYHVKSFMKGQYKYIKGTTKEGQYDHVLLERNPNVTDPREANYVDVIQNSLVSLAVAKFDESPLSASKIESLRTQAQVECGQQLHTTCNPLQEECLFNIWQDPCEQNNLARNPEYQDKLNEMKQRLEELRQLAITPRVGGSQIDNDPSRHDCTWVNFLQEPAPPLTSLRFNVLTALSHLYENQIHDEALSIIWLIIINYKSWDGNTKPNIVIIMADDMGFDDVSFRGSNEFLTPNIDILRPWPTVVSALLTGKYPINTGMQHYVIVNDQPWSLPLNETTMAEIFRHNGYYTSLIGKWHLGMSRKAYTPTLRGFDQHYGYLGSYVDYYDQTMEQFGKNYSRGHDFRDNLKPSHEGNGTYVTDLLTRATLKRIRKHDFQQKPLFLLLSHLAPHSANDDVPLQAPAEEIEKFAYIENPDRRIYAAMMSKLDESVGQVVKGLAEKGVLNNTILLFLSDNGGPSAGMHATTASNYPFRGQKNSPWEGGIRSAAVIWSTQLDKLGTIWQQPIYIADLLPTLAAAANIPLDLGKLQLDGINLWSALKYGYESVEREILHNIDDIFQYEVYTKGKWKYINGTTQEGLYDNWLSQRPDPNDTSQIDPRFTIYEELVKSTPVWQELQKLTSYTNHNITKLRDSAAIQCLYDHATEGIPCNPLQSPCLFDLDTDPCEQQNLYEKYENSSILADMLERIEYFRENAHAINNKPADLRCDPAKFGGEWTWWEDIIEGNAAKHLAALSFLKLFTLTSIVLVLSCKLIM
ncbi:Arylsulfatase B [Lucilia cuprina]|nr:Arylsulfatase B [Lucilia cuprina]